jgi:hypothetical protein
VPKAKRGEVIEIKTLISHVMETGFRPQRPAGRSRATSSRRSSCTYNGEEIFAPSFYPAIAANPFVTFHTVATESGTLAFHWTGDNGFNLSCAICHDDNAGKKLAGVTIPEAHPTGYPIYRLEWQALGSLKRRLRNCLVGIRAEAYPYDALEYVALELFLMDRARGMVVESPGVRP